MGWKPKSVREKKPELCMQFCEISLLYLNLNSFNYDVWWSYEKQVAGVYFVVGNWGDALVEKVFDVKHKGLNLNL